MVTICTASLTFNNSTFCPHTVFMCFVWISEQTAIIFNAPLSLSLSLSHYPPLSLSRHVWTVTRSHLIRLVNKPILSSPPLFIRPSVWYQIQGLTSCRIFLKTDPTVLYSKFSSKRDFHESRICDGHILLKCGSEFISTISGSLPIVVQLGIEFFPRVMLQNFQCPNNLFQRA